MERRRWTLRLIGPVSLLSIQLDYPNDRDVMDVFICSERLSYSQVDHTARLGFGPADNSTPRADTTLA